MKILRLLISSLFSGICISIGCIAFLTCDSRVVGALFFTVGLFTICTFGLDLFTGKLCYTSNVPTLALIWLGNLAGCLIMGWITLHTRMGLEDKAHTVAQAKVDDNFLSLFLLAILCNVMIFIAVDGFKNNPHELGKYLALFFGVSIFVLCGFEHCIADMFYFTMNGWDGRTILCELVITAGNFVGGFIPSRLMARRRNASS